MCMGEFRIIKRYNAYYRGWCTTFGEHRADYQEERKINWLYGEDKVGMILSPRLLKRMHKELLGHQDEMPQLRVTESSVSFNEFNLHLTDSIDKQAAKFLKRFLRDSPSLHMYLCSHLFYPPRTRIVTFARKKPITIMYKEMQPLKLIVK